MGGIGLNIICIVQSRMDSARFPGKVMAYLAGAPILGHCVARCMAAKLPVVVATTDRAVDDPIAAYGVTTNVDVFRWGGDTDDVLGRYVACATEYDAAAIIRITGDSPFVPVAALEVVAGALKDQADIASFTARLRTVPDGWEAEGCSMAQLLKFDQETWNGQEREHVFPAGYENNYGIRPATETDRWNSPWLMEQKFSVDTPDDLQWLERIAMHIDCRPPNPTGEEMVAFLEDHPEFQRKKVI